MSASTPPRKSPTVQIISLVEELAGEPKGRGIVKKGVVARKGETQMICQPNRRVGNVSLTLCLQSCFLGLK